MEVIFLIIAIGLISTVCSSLLEKSGNKTGAMFINIVSFLLAWGILLKMIILLLKDVSDRFL